VRESQLIEEEAGRGAARPRDPFRNTWLIVGALTLLALGLRLVTLDRASLWVDEGCEAQYVSYPLEYCWKADNNVPPLNRTMLHFWTYIAGTSEFSFRFPSAFFGTLCIPALYLLGRQTLGKKVGLTAALLLAISPFALEFSQEARQYPLLVLLTILATYCFFRIVERPRLSLFMLYALLVAAGLYTFYPFALVVAGHVIWYLAAARKSRRTVIGLAYSYLAAGLLYLPWVPTLIGAMRSQERHWIQGMWLQAYQVFQHFGPGFAAYDVGWLLGSISWSPTFIWGREIIFLLGFVVPFLCGILSAVRQGRVGLYFPMAFFLPLIFLLALFPIMPLLSPRYFQFALPVYLLLLSAFLVNFKVPEVRFFTVACISTLLALSLITYYFLPSNGKEDFRSAAALITRESSDNDVIVCLPGYMSGGVEYYYKGKCRVLRAVEWDAKDDAAMTGSQSATEAASSQAAGGPAPDSGAAKGAPVDLGKIPTMFANKEDYAAAMKALSADPTRRLWVVIRGTDRQYSVRYDKFFRRYFPHYRHVRFGGGWGIYVYEYCKSPFPEETHDADASNEKSDATPSPPKTQ
jgi:4-amino-4-deoxy-L-arabinose transferase-like glycosyltransferase